MKKNFEKILIGVLYGCEDVNNLKRVSKIMKEAANLMEVEPIKECYHKYEPYGLTYTLIIKESVITFSSYPEHRSALIYLSSCNLNSKLNEAFEYIAKEFKSEKKKIYFNCTVSLGMF